MRYRAAIVGCGRKAATIDDEERCRINYSIPPDAHASAYAAMPRVELVAAADPNEFKRRMMQERWKVPAVYDDYREMLAREQPDLVSVTTRASLHAEVTLAAVAAGVKGVLCEKAMAISLSEADAMIEACRRAGTKLVINHTRRWHPTYEQAVQALQNGVIGQLRCIVGTCPGPLIHNGTHMFDIMRLFGGDVEWVSGQVSSSSSEDAPGRALLGFANGVAGFVDLDGGLGLAAELQGSEGRLFIDSAEDGFDLWEYRAPAAVSAGARLAREPGVAAQVLGSPANLRGSRPVGRAWYQGGPCRQRASRRLSSGAGPGTLIAAVEELITCIEGDRESRSGGREGRAALEVALAVYHSHAAGGVRIRLPLQDRTLAVQSR